MGGVMMSTMQAIRIYCEFQIYINYLPELKSMRGFFSITRAFVNMPKVMYTQQLRI